jgi:hypothetical protein
MIPRIGDTPSDAALERMFAFAERRSSTMTSAGILGAILLHAAVAFALPAKEARVEPPPAALEVDFTQAPEVALPPPEPRTELASPAPTAAQSPPRAGPKPNGAPPLAARAGDLLTAKDDGAKNAKDEPVEFVTDPDGAAYGSGVVAKGGTADVGLAGASANGASGGTGVKAAASATAGAPRSASTAETITPAANLSRLPKLTEADACKGFFPSEASDDAATVTLVVVVKTTGAVSSASIVAESPKGEGFGNAARACLLSKHFAPGLDQSGAATLAAATLNVHFSR